MGNSYDLWKLLAGVAIFLIGVTFLEDSLQQLAGRRFKIFLKKQTASKIKAISGGAIVTAVLQSSSVVSLMVLAFVGAGIIATNNALAVVLGANLGTTFTGWVIALLGFNFNIENFALPVAGFAGLGYALLNKQSKVHAWCHFLLGFSFLFIGLGYMKTGIEQLVIQFDLSQYEGSPLAIFLLIGFVLTTIIQSSSATVAITLSALYAGAISLYDATAIVLGSEVGTTIKLFVASLKGIPAKRRVALGNFTFNTVGVIVVLIFLKPLNHFLTNFIGITDKLIGLVFFQTMVNVIGIFLFYPFLNLTGRVLERMFRKNEDETMFIHKVATRETSMALFALEEENRHFIAAVCNYTLSCFEVQDVMKKEMGVGQKFLTHGLIGKYEHLKFLYGEIHSYYIQLQKSISDKEETERMDKLMSSVRNAMYAAKSFKDSIPDKVQLHNSSNEVKYAFYNQTRNQVADICVRIQSLLKNEDFLDNKELFGIYKKITEGYTATLKNLYMETTAGHVNETEITTLLNFNREVFTGFKSLLFSVKDYLLDKEQSKYFDELPGFIR